MNMGMKKMEFNFEMRKGRTWTKTRHTNKPTSHGQSSVYLICDA
jgi:hypothetical protein